MQAVGFAAQIHWRRANRFVIPRSEATWESRSTMVNNRNASAKTQPVAGDCHVGLRPARNDNSGAFTILTRPCLYRRCSAGPGCPLPYKACAFARQLVQIGSDSPRLPRPLWGLSGSQRGHKTAAEELSPAAAVIPENQMRATPEALAASATAAATALPTRGSNAFGMI